MAIIYKTLEIPLSNNFIRLCNDNTTDDIIITDIIPPANAINGYQLNVLLGPNITSIGDQDLAAKRALSLNWKKDIVYKTYSNDISPHANYTNIIFPNFSMCHPVNGTPSYTYCEFSHYGAANVAYDPNKYLDSSFVPHEPTDSLSFCQKLIQFVYVTDFYPLRYKETRSEWIFNVNTKGSFWMIQNIQHFYFLNPLSK